MPALTWFYGLRPWEVEELSQDELAEYLRQYDEFVRHRKG